MLGVEHIVKDFNLNGSSIKNVKLIKRGAAMGENSVKTSTLIPESQIPMQMSVKEPPLQSSKMATLNQQFPEVLTEPVLQTSPKLIQNDYVSLARSPNSNQPQAIPNQLYSQTQQSLKQPEDSVHMYTQKTSPQRTQKIYQTKTYEFGSSLFEEDSDEKPNIFIKSEQIEHGIDDDEEIIRKAQQTSAKNTKNNEEVKLMSEQLKQQMEEMENMMKQLTNQPQTEIKQKEAPKQEPMKLEDSIPKMEFDEPIAVSQKPLSEIKEKKALPPMKSKSERKNRTITSKICQQTRFNSKRKKTKVIYEFIVIFHSTKPRIYPITLEYFINFEIMQIKLCNVVYTNIIIIIHSSIQYYVYVLVCMHLPTERAKNTRGRMKDTLSIPSSFIMQQNDPILQKQLKLHVRNEIWSTVLTKSSYFTPKCIYPVILSLFWLTYLIVLRISSDNVCLTQFNRILKPPCIKLSITSEFALLLLIISFQSVIVIQNIFWHSSCTLKQLLTVLKQLLTN
ncbi:Hypothetical_protein [Hexamita inflata]|uniref:Hypothetical_protein n=1 Tax=Hexamita inflata TaxID=28002 RepID=A0ABP1H923_9EUKA